MKLDEMMLKILDEMEDGIYITDHDYYIQYMNREMTKIFGQGVGKKCYQVFYCSNAICPWCQAEETFAGTTTSLEAEVPTVGKTFFIKNIPLKDTSGQLFKLSIFRDISLRKESERQLKTSEENFRQIFENVGCGVFVSTREGRFVDANPALLQMLGYSSKEEFLKIDIYQDLYLRPEDRRKFQALIEKQGKVVDYEVEFKRADGTPISILLTANVRYDESGKIIGYQGLNVDQTQRKTMERELQEAHTFLNMVVQSSPNPIMSADMKGNIIIWNQAAEETLGYTSDEVIGKMHITQIYTQGMAHKIMRMLRSPQHGGEGRLKSYPMFFVRKDGSLVEGNLSASILYDDKGREVASLGIFVDLEERLAMEKRLRETQEQLLQSEKLAAMGRLTSQIAHELNNPLYGIMNTLELMKSEISPDNKRRKILDMALSEATRLSQLLRKMLTFSKPDQSERQRLDLNEVIDEILVLYEKQMREHSIRMETAYAQDAGQVVASKDQIRQVILNMINNARDAMPEGGTLRVTTSARHGWFVISIADSGIGVSKGDISKIFNAFYTTKDSVKGVGLGLSVCYGFIKEHGGHIEVESELGAGTTFTISLPLAESNQFQKNLNISNISNKV